MVIYEYKIRFGYNQSGSIADIVYIGCNQLILSKQIHGLQKNVVFQACLIPTFEECTSIARKQTISGTQLVLKSGASSSTTSTQIYFLAHETNGSTMSAVKYKEASNLLLDSIGYKLYR